MLVAAGCACGCTADDAVLAVARGLFAQHARGDAQVSHRPSPVTWDTQWPDVHDYWVRQTVRIG